MLKKVAHERNAHSHILLKLIILYLLSFVDDLQWCHLTFLVISEHLTHGAGGHLTGEAVDVDLLVFMLVTHQLSLLCFGQEWP